MKNLHIIIYSPFPRYSGGRENWLYNILPRISSSFHQVFIYSYKTNRKVFYDLSGIHNVVLEEIESIRYPFFLFAVLNKLSLQTLFLLDSFILFRRNVRSALSREVQPGDIVLTLNSIIETLPAVDVRKAGVNFRLLCAVRGLVPVELGNLLPPLRSWFIHLEKKLLYEVDAIISNGNDTQDYLRQIGFESEVIPNGVDVHQFQSPQFSGKVFEELQTIKSGGQKIIMMVATLRKIKGIDDLLIAGKCLKDEGIKNFKLVFVGKGDQTPFRLAAKKLGIEDEVVFLGEQKNISALLSLSDVVVCTSGGSGMSMAALEAMASGRPTVAWDTPVYRQLFHHLQDGYLAEYPNHDDLAKGIYRLLEDASLAELFEENLKIKVANFDWPVITRKLLEKL